MQVRHFLIVGSVQHLFGSNLLRQLDRGKQLEHFLGRCHIVDPNTDETRMNHGQGPLHEQSTLIDFQGPLMQFAVTVVPPALHVVSVYTIPSTGRDKQASPGA